MDPHFHENESLMEGLRSAILGRTGIDPEGLSVLTFFADTERDETFSRNRFVINLDKAYESHVETALNIVRAYGLSDRDATVRLRDLFLLNALRKEGSQLVASIKRQFNIQADSDALGAYEGMIVEDPWTFSDRAVLPIWFKDSALLDKVVKSPDCENSINVGTKVSPPRRVDILYTVASL